MPTEIEKKYRVSAAQAAELRTRLSAVGAAAGDVEFEVNTIYGGPGLDPRVNVLRVRRTGARAVLTYKERRASAAPIKHQREDETEVANVDALAAILDALGYKPALLYEKRRATWRLAGAEVVIDELPFGWFVEIEGSEEAIEAAERQLEMTGLAVEHATYPELTRQLGVPRAGLIEARFASVSNPDAHT